MIDESHLEQNLRTLVKGKCDVVLFGNRSSGKTTLATKILDEVVGKNNYITIKCIFLSDKGSLYYLIAVEIKRICDKLDSVFMLDQLTRKTIFKITLKNDGNTSFQAFIKNFNKMIKLNQGFFKKVGRIYIFMDNMEDMCLEDHFFKQFYYGMKNYIKILNISFFFCGQSMKSPFSGIYQPLRNIPYFYMPKPNVGKIIDNAIKQSPLYKSTKEKQQKLSKTSEDKEEIVTFNRLFKHLRDALAHSFDTIQYQIERVFFIAHNFLQYVEQYVARRTDNARYWLEKNQDQQKSLLKRLKQYGTTTERATNQFVRKQVGIKEVGEEEPTFYMENYASLIATGLGLANGYPQSQDVKRFMDLKGHKTSRAKASIKKKNPESTFKLDPKKVRHNLYRILSIAQTLQQQSTGPRLKQKNLPHHTLDYYGCIQYLREEGYINFYGKSTAKYGGYITGIPKESEVKDFIKKLDLDYLQFTGKD